MAGIRSLVVNIGWLGAAHALDYVLRALIGIIVARHLGVEQFGVFAPALGTALLAAVFADAGLNMSVLRAGSSAPESLRGVIAFALRAKAALLAALFAILLVIGPLIGFDGFKLQILAILAAGVLLGSFMELFAAVLQSRERMAAYGALTAGFRVLLLAGVAVAAFSDGDITAVALAYAGAGIIGSALAGLIAWPTLRRLPKRGADIRALVGDALQFGAAGILTAVLLQSGQVMMLGLHSQAESGLFGAAMRLVVILYALPTVVQRAALPRLFAYAQQPERLAAAYGTLMRWSSAVSAAVGGVAAALAPVLTVFVLGEEYQAAATAFALLALGLWPHQINYVLGDTLYALRLQGRRAAALGAAAALVIALNFALIPPLGSLGAALSMLCGELALLLLLAVPLMKRLPGTFGALIPLLPGGAAALLLPAMRGQYWALQLLCGGIAAAAVLGLLLAVGYLKLDDLVRRGRGGQQENEPSRIATGESVDA